MPDTGVFQFIQDLLAQTFGFAPPQLLLRVIAGILLLGLLAIGAQVVTTAVKTLIEVVQPLLYNRDDRRRRFRRHLFADYIDGEIRYLNSKEAWNDNRFTELEAEVEAEGGRLLLGFIPIGSFRGMGLRREKSLSRAIEHSSERLILLEGDPGSGKSVALRHVAQLMASKVKKSGHLKMRMPVYVNLKYLNRPTNEEIGRKLIEDYVLRVLNRVNDRDIDDFLHEEFQRGLSDGTWFFLFDSFDEIPEVLSSTGTDTTIRQYAEAIRDFLHGMNKCKGIVASREYKGPRFLGWPKFHVLPLTNHQRREFIKKTGLQTAIQRTILSGLGQSTVDFKVMASNPMFLNLICEYMGRQKDGQFPKQTYSVYDEYIERRFSLDENRLVSRFQLKPEDIRLAAEKLAYCMTADKDLSLSPNLNILSVSLSRFGLELNVDFEKIIRALEYIKIARIESSGVMDSKTFTFSHRRFQEFFATAIVLKESHRTSPKTLLFDARWRETAVTILQTKDAKDLVPIFDEAYAFLNSLKYPVSSVMENKSPKDGIRNKVNADIFSLSDAEIRENIRLYFRKSLRTYFRRARGRLRRKEVVFQLPLSWSKDYYHLMSILQDGLSGRYQIIDTKLRELINLSLEYGFLNGSIVDKKWILDVAGVADRNVISSLFLAAFETGGDWIRNSAFWLISKIDRISLELVPDIRKALVQMALNRELSFENSDILIQFSRLSDYKSLAHIVRLLLLVPTLDVLFGISSIVFIVFLPELSLPNWVYVMLILYPLVCLWVKWSKISRLLMSANNTELFLGLSFVPSVIVIIGVIFYGLGIFGGIKEITILNVLNAIEGLPNRYHNIPVIMYLGYALLNAWSGVAIAEASNSKRVHPLWWPFYFLYPIAVLAMFVAVLISILPIMIVRLFQFLYKLALYSVFVAKRIRVIARPATYYLALQLTILRRSVRTSLTRFYENFHREIWLPLLTSRSQLIGTLMGSMLCIALFAVVVYGDTIIKPIVSFFETNYHVGLLVEFFTTNHYVDLLVEILATYGLLLLALLLMLMMFVRWSDTTILLEQFRVATFDQFQNYQRLISIKSEISVSEILEMVDSLDISFLRVMLIRNIREKQLLIANSKNESQLAVSVAFIDGLLSIVVKPELNNYIRTFISDKENIPAQLTHRLLQMVSDKRENNLRFTKWDQKQFSELCKLFDQVHVN